MDGLIFARVRSFPDMTEHFLEHLLNDKDYAPAVENQGFGQDRIIRLVPAFYKYSQGQLVPVDVPG